MTRRADDRIRRWVRLYTRGVTEDIARDRQQEIDSDLFEYRAAARIAGMSEAGVDRAIMRRGFVGIAADISWRERELRRSYAAKLASLPPVRRRSIGRVVVATYVLGGLLVGLGALAVVRLWTPGGANALVPTIREGILAATIACLVSLYFATRPSSRVPGMLGLAVAAIPLTYGVMTGMEGISARGAYVLYRLALLMPSEVTHWVTELAPGILLAILLYWGALWLRRSSPDTTATK